MTNTPSPRDRDSSEQDQFLTILSREDALARFEAALFPRAITSEVRPLADALGCALAEDVVAAIDVPPFDRSNVDGFAVRSADLASAAEASPVEMMATHGARATVTCAMPQAASMPISREPMMVPARSSASPRAISEPA